MVCCLVALASLVLTLLAAQSSRDRATAVGLGLLLLLCNGLMAAVGLVRHSGQGFWHRLTVHEEQAAGRVGCGWQEALRPLLDTGLRRLKEDGLWSAPRGCTVACLLPMAALTAVGWRRLSILNRTVR